jgi:hypothetical protein
MLRTSSRMPLACPQRPFHTTPKDRSISLPSFRQAHTPSTTPKLSTSRRPSSPVLATASTLVCRSGVLSTLVSTRYTRCALRLSNHSKAHGRRPSGSLPLSDMALLLTWQVTPSVFDAWMTVLKRVPGSVLWLLNEPREARPNMCRQAKKRGISCSRIIHTDKVPLAKHLLVKVQSPFAAPALMFRISKKRLSHPRHRTGHS